MRVLIKQAINDLDHKELPQENMHKFITNETNPTVLKVINILKEHFSFTLKPESFWQVLHCYNGQPWHTDIGVNHHMTWCEVGCSILLTSPKEDFSGGETLYDKENPIVSTRDKYDIIAHTSDEWHMVNTHKGNRVVFLIFI
jgi:hypothetical protein